MAGKLIVIEGGDGAGKATQAKLLIERLQTDGYEVKTLDFPRYTDNQFGRLIRECLDGKRGDFMAMDPRVVATLYAADRFETKQVLEDWLAAGHIVVLDRYVSANMMHQGAKLQNDAELPDLITWIDHTEFEVFGVPRPDLTFYFDIPHEIRQKLKQQAVNEGKHTGELDVAEQDQEHQRKVGERARKIVDLRPDWYQVTCCNDDEELRTIEIIHEEVYEKVTSIL